MRINKIIIPILILLSVDLCGIYYIGGIAVSTNCTSA